MRPSLYDFCTGHEQTHLLAQWDGERNAPLTPKDVTYGSHQKVWWYCASGHHWQAKIYSLLRRQRMSILLRAFGRAKEGPANVLSRA